MGRLISLQIHSYSFSKLVNLHTRFYVITETFCFPLMLGD